MPQRPTVVTAFGWLNIAFGAYGLLSLGFVGLFVYALGGTASPAFAMFQTGFFAAYLILSVFLGALASLVLVAGGIGLLQSQRWGRTLTLVYAFFSIVNGIAGTLFSMGYLLGPLMDQGSGPAVAGAIGGAIGGIVGGCVSLVYPGVLLWGMSRPELKAYLAAVDPPD